jgi:hypothetical protein
MYPINPTVIIFRFWLGFMLSFFLFQFIYYHILSISSSPLLGSFPLGMVLSLSGSFTACLSWSDDYIYITLGEIRFRLFPVLKFSVMFHEHIYEWFHSCVS